MKKVSSDLEHGRFVVHLSLDTQPLTIELNLDFDSGTASYKTTFARGQQKGFHPPAALRRFFQPEFVDLFVFDGELAGRLLDAHQTRAYDAVDALFQLSLLRHLGDCLYDNWTEHARSVTAKEEKGLNRRRNRLNELKRKYERVQKERNALVKSRLTIQKKQQQLAQQYKSRLVEDERLKKEFDRLEQEWKTVNLRAKATLSTVLGACRDPQKVSLAFGETLVALKANLDKLKLRNLAQGSFLTNWQMKPNAYVDGLSDPQSNKLSGNERSITSAAMMSQY